MLATTPTLEDGESTAVETMTLGVGEDERRLCAASETLSRSPSGRGRRTIFSSRPTTVDMEPAVALLKRVEQLEVKMRRHDRVIHTLIRDISLLKTSGGRGSSTLAFSASGSLGKLQSPLTPYSAAMENYLEGAGGATPYGLNLTLGAPFVKTATPVKVPSKAAQASSNGGGKQRRPSGSVSNNINGMSDAGASKGRPVEAPQRNLSPKMVKNGANGTTVMSTAEATEKHQTNLRVSGKFDMDDLKFLTSKLPKTPPVFTTPTLDFSSHHSELLDLTSAVLDFVTSYHTKHFPLACPLRTDSQRTQERLLKNRRVVTAVSMVISHFNLLTTPNPLHRSSSSSPPFNASKDAWPSLTSPHPSFDSTLAKHQRASYHYLRGRLYAMLPWPDTRAEADLNRCLKLNPSLHDAWNLLGEWYYGSCSPLAGEGLLPGDSVKFRTGLKAEDARRLAVACFERGLEGKRNRDGLLNLAMTVRAVAVGDGKEEVEALLQRSVALCKEALAMDVGDGLSWFGLGSTYLKFFFNVSFDSKDLYKALAAYNKAASSVDMVNHPDLYRNRAIVNLYLENYPSSLDDFGRSSTLDPLDIGPDCDAQVHTILSMVQNVSKSIERHRVASAVSGAERKTSVKKSTKEVAVEACKVLGSGQIEKKGEVNADVVVVVKVLEVLGNGLPRTYAVEDVNGSTIFGLSIFNLADGSVPIAAGDELSISSPVFTRFDINYGKFSAKYLNLRVDKPWLIAVNGVGLAKGSLAITQVRVQTVV
ncbi:hypothetical protein HDU67_002264 [Dinochytrium kinnereticum]|nr:hypothetical protein HDU67_002264 [Dinochytrium kinnereticum]